nr:RNA-directed DNA polymerase, eukaryota [Tanacetum cinerariifolium]
VKDKQEKDKIELKPDKNGKRGEAGSFKSSCSQESKKNLKKMQIEGPKLHTPTKLLKKGEKKGTRTAITSKYNHKGQFCPLLKVALDEAISKMKKRLSRWKLNTLSAGGRFTLLKSVLGSTPIYNMSIFKVPKSVLNLLESLRRNFLMAFKMVIERLLGSNGLRCSLLRNMERLEFQVFMLSIGLFFSSGYGATFLMIILMVSGYICYSWLEWSSSFCRFQFDMELYH